MEKLILEDLRDYTLGAVREEMKKEDTELEAKMADLQFLTMANLDVSEVCQKNEEVMNKVKEQLQQIQNVFSPAEKVVCVVWPSVASWSALSSPTEPWEPCYRAGTRQEMMRVLMISFLRSFTSSSSRRSPSFRLRWSTFPDSVTRTSCFLRAAIA